MIAMLMLQKLIGMASGPLALIIAGLVLGTVLGFTRWRRTSRIILVTATIAITLAAVLPLGRWLMIPLEDRFPPRPPPAEIDGIIILGGFGNQKLSEARGQIVVNDAIERLTGPPVFTTSTVTAFLLHLNETEQFIYLWKQLAILSQNLTSVIKADFRTIKESVRIGKRAHYVLWKSVPF